MGKKYINAALTVEAALYMPLLLLIFILAMRGGLNLYTQTTKQAQELKEKSNIDVLELFYGKERVEELFENGD